MFNKQCIILLILLTSITFQAANFLNVARASPNIIRVPSADTPTIQSAIDSAKLGDIILVSPGEYNEHLHITGKSLSIIGENQEKTIIIGENPVIRVASCTHVVIANFTIKGVGNPIQTECNGIFLYNSSYTTIANVTIIDNKYVGILLRQSNYTLIENCLVKNNYIGLLIYPTSLNNAIVHNNFVNNNISCIIYPSASVFYNYWDDYRGKDDNGDGVGDTPYVGNIGSDECPLMEPWTLSKLTKKFSVGTYNITVYSNAMISAFNYNQSLKEISFNLNGPSTPSRLTFFCKVYVPKALLHASAQEKWRVLLNCTEVPVEVSTTEDYTLINFTGHFSKLRVQVQVVISTEDSKFSMLIIMLVLVVIASVTAAIAFTKFKKQRLKTR